MSRIVLLGPQRLEPTLGSALRELEVDGPVALVTAGWREIENDDRAIAQDAGVETINLELYHRAEAVFDADPELHQTLRRRQRRLKELQRLYRRRLDCALDGYREIRDLYAVRAEDSDLLERERLAALEAVRALDEHHFRSVREVHEQAAKEAPPGERSAVARHREEIRELIEPCQAVVFAGGHVAALLNRLRLFDVASAVGERPLVAWSAGAMALSERIVLFHDNPPWGAGNAEVLDHGLGLCPGVLPLPHARRRLRLNDPERVDLLVRRFAPLRCVGLDEGSKLRGRGAMWAGEPVWSGDRVMILDLEVDKKTPANGTKAEPLAQEAVS